MLSTIIEILMLIITVAILLIFLGIVLTICSKLHISDSKRVLITATVGVIYAIIMSHILHSIFHPL